MVGCLCSLPSRPILWAGQKVEPTLKHSLELTPQRGPEQTTGLSIIHALNVILVLGCAL